MDKLSEILAVVDSPLVLPAVEEVPSVVALLAQLERDTAKADELAGEVRAGEETLASLLEEKKRLSDAYDEYMKISPMPFDSQMCQTQPQVDLERVRRAYEEMLRLQAVGEVALAERERSICELEKELELLEKEMTGLTNADDSQMKAVRIVALVSLASPVHKRKRFPFPS